MSDVLPESKQPPANPAPPRSSSKVVIFLTVTGMLLVLSLAGGFLAGQTWAGSSEPQEQVKHPLEEDIEKLEFEKKRVKQDLDQLNNEKSQLKQDNKKLQQQKDKVSCSQTPNAHSQQQRRETLGTLAQ